MPLLPQTVYQRLLANGAVTRSLEGVAVVDFYPVAVIRMPDGPCIWLLTHAHLDEPDIAYGLIDISDGQPTMGKVSLAELDAARGPLGMMLYHDDTTATVKTISQLAALAYHAGRIEL